MSEQPLTFADLPSIDTPRRGRRAASRAERPLRGWSVDWSRRDLLKRTMAAGTALGLASLGVLPPARRAVAGHASNSDGYQIMSTSASHDRGPCSRGNYARSHNCKGCGPSDTSRDYCITDQSDPHYGWHRTEGLQWRLRRNACWAGYYDGWKWRFRPVGECHGCRQVVEFRCHDGRRCDSNGNNCFPTVCRWKTRCD
jgi:hypothetical protein